MSALHETAFDVPSSLLVGGDWRPAADDARFEVADPATGAAIASVASAGPDDARAAVEAAAAAFPTWAATAPRERGELLRRAFELVHLHADELVELIVRENGKPLADARAELAYAAEFLRWYSEEAVRIDGSLTRSPDGTMNLLVRRQPIGVALLVTPWNLPLAMVTRKVAPALAAGCTVVVKPAISTPLCALRFAQLLEQAGLPAGVVNVLPTARSRAVVSAALAAEPVRKLSFTGSTEVGRLLLAQAAERIVSCSMELGGNAPLIVLADADLDAAVSATLVAKMRHNGEACTAANRIYVDEQIAATYTDRLAAAMRALRVGPGLDPASQVGPLIDADARDKVSALTQDAIDAGARMVAGGARPAGEPGSFQNPTVLADVAPDSPILAEEIFGPVAPVVAFGDERELLAMANASEHGLMSYVFSADVGKALRLADALESGMVAVNRGVISDPAAPFGGVKQSGVGREGGHDGMLEYTETKYVGVDW
jgi:succinate-semialdehyde dehydrogenase/glutarate-semialdehyde dehydrogenase